MSADARRPIDATEVRSPDGWSVSVVAETGSTNADLLDAAARTPGGSVLVAEAQTAGRGRLDRAWSSPPGAGLLFSFLVRPTCPRAHWGWLPLLTGVALVDTVGALSTGPARAALKWPNDLLAAAGAGGELRKAAGILLAASGDAVVVGVGLNVSTTTEELPVPTATSLSLCGIEAARADVLSVFLAAFGDLYSGWEAAGGAAPACGLADRYRQACDTLGRRVRVELPRDGALVGTAVDVDDSGCLLVDAGSGPVAVSAGDVVHLRPV